MLALLALVYFAWPFYRAFLGLYIDFNDSWNAYHADAIRNGDPLYTFNDLVSNNYPPLSFYLLRVISVALVSMYVTSIARSAT